MAVWRGIIALIIQNWSLLYDLHEVCGHHSITAAIYGMVILISEAARKVPPQTKAEEML